MAQPHADLLGRRIKELSSEVKKLRGWAASDETVADRLVDALNELTAQRLLAHAYAEATPDAQDALTRANKLVAAHGAVGPFTPINDGVRFATATTQLAAAQSGAGQVALGAQMAQAVRGWAALLPHVDLTPYLAPRTAVWLLAAQASGAREAGDLAAANAFADAAVDRAREGRLAGGPDAPALVDALRLAAEIRWIAGLGHDAVSLTREALNAATDVAGPVLAQPARVAAAWVERALPPLAAARRDLADRLAGEGDTEGGLAERRALVALLQDHAGRLGAPARDAMAHALADLAGDLLAVDREDEALEAAGQAASVAGELASTEATPGRHLAAQFAAVTALAAALQRLDQPGEALEALASLQDRYQSLGQPAGHEAALALATIVRAGALHSTGDHEGADHAIQQVNALVAGLRAAPGAALYADVPSDVFVRDRARGVATRARRPSPSWSVLSDADALAACTRAPLAIPSPEVPVEPAPVWTPPPAPAVDPEPEPVAPEPIVEPEPAWEPEPEPIVEPEPAWEPEPLVVVSASAAYEAARQAYEAAKASGNRRDTLTAATSVVDELRPLAEVDFTRWGPALATALDDLGDARFRSGDWWGSRAPKKEAKALAKQLGL